MNTEIFNCYGIPITESFLDFDADLKLFNTYHRKTNSKIKNYIVIGVHDGKVFDGISHHESQVFFSCLENTEYVVIGTEREFNLIVEQLCFFDLKCIIIENDFNFVENVHYYSNAEYNYSQAKNKFSMIRSFNALSCNIRKSMAHKIKGKFFSKIRKKTNYDYLFGVADNTPIRELFAFSEERADRVIFALDVNSMYLSCMTMKFGNPQHLKRINDPKALSVENLQHGLYHVKLSAAKTEFIKEYHPFKYEKGGLKYPFVLEDDFEIKTLASHEELSFYRNHFNKIEILGGVYFEKKTEHPLLKMGLNFFQKKLNSKNKELSKFIKTCLVYLTSASTVKVISKKTFRNEDQVNEYLSNKYSTPLGILKDTKSAGLVSKIIPKYTYKIKNGFHITERNFDSPKTIQSFGYEIVSRSRIHMLTFMEKINSCNYADICYANVDSLHVSVNRLHLEEFLELLNPYISTSKLGAFKIEAIADRAYWLGIGHYYLINNNKLVKFRAPTMQQRINFVKIKTKRKILRIIRTKFFNFITSKTIHIEKTLSYRKSISCNKNEFTRQERLKVKDIRERNFSIDKMCTEIKFAKEKIKYVISKIPYSNT